MGSAVGQAVTLPERPITILIAALGGEGGGVMADWLMEAATAAELPAQATSIPGVAQRTGATTYYLEIYPVRRGELGAREPVLSLTPSPGNVDIMVASELVEAGRAMVNGYVSPERTTLIASTHRIYATIEKMQMADGRFESDKVTAAAARRRACAASPPTSTSFAATAPRRSRPHRRSAPPSSTTSSPWQTNG